MNTALIKVAYWIGFWSGRQETRRALQYPRKWY